PLRHRNVPHPPPTSRPLGTPAPMQGATMTDHLADEDREALAALTAELAGTESGADYFTADWHEALRSDDPYCWASPAGVAEAIVRSRWLVADRARVRAETRERIAQAIEAELVCCDGEARHGG